MNNKFKLTTLLTPLILISTLISTPVLSHTNCRTNASGNLVCKTDGTTTTYRVDANKRVRGSDGSVCRTDANDKVRCK